MYACAKHNQSGYDGKCPACATEQAALAKRSQALVAVVALLALAVLLVFLVLIERRNARLGVRTPSIFMPMDSP